MQIQMFVKKGRLITNAQSDTRNNSENDDNFLSYKYTCKYPYTIYLRTGEEQQKKTQKKYINKQGYQTNACSLFVCAWSTL